MTIKSPPHWKRTDQAEGSRSAYRDMEAFIDTVSDPRLAERLMRAIHGKGALAHFRSELERSPAELTRWHRYADDSSRGRARAWLANNGYNPAV